MMTIKRFFLVPLFFPTTLDCYYALPLVEVPQDKFDRMSQARFPYCKKRKWLLLGGLGGGGGGGGFGVGGWGGVWWGVWGGGVGDK